MASLVCLLAAFSAGADGYQIAMQASIIANKGFVQQFATAVSEEGEKFLASNIIATWSAGQNVGQFLGQIGISFVVARFGRKISMYTLWTILMRSVLAESHARTWPVWFGAKMLAGTGEERAKKSIRFIYRSVENFDADRHYELLALNVEHEKALAAEQRNESWLAIFKGINARRTITAMWTIVAQQFLGLALFSSFGTYFFQQAGLADPFQIKAITTSVQIIVVILAVFGVDKFGRRRMACCDTSLMWISCLIVGIIGVAPQSGASAYVFVLFACSWTSANSVTGLIMSVLTPHVVNANKWDWKLKTGFFYAGVGLPWVIGTWLRSPAELDELFECKIKAWRFHTTETATQRLMQNENAEATEK
ncbi:General alpha-glucoside permease [Fusarium agapanthi]|uniref:General alpha-glucoside permease n=1 Tax=Fusarium agapanthi TaxID=1803897 RepID=A0A9P5ECX9_9HYPO|nr:General alpha-glucoside permease [Fusarium agapanthi]